MERINRSKDDFFNNPIYMNFDENEVSALTDEEFEILRNKLKNYAQLISNPPARFFDFFEGRNGTSIKGDRDDTDFQIYKRISMATSISRVCCYYRYQSIFTFINTLGVKNIYDIGCGDDLQASLLIYHPEINYTGIDIDGIINIFDDFNPEIDYINKLFKSFTGSERIKYIKSKYPCELSVEENNIAILIGVLTWVKTSSDIISSINKNFERVILDIRHQGLNKALKEMSVKDVVYQDVKITVDVFEDELTRLKAMMPDFTFYQIGHALLFGTRNAEDIDKLEKRYDRSGNTLKSWVVEKGWADEVLK